jgi:hypothetical protein
MLGASSDPSANVLVGGIGGKGMPFKIVDKAFADLGNVFQSEYEGSGQKKGSC